MLITKRKHLPFYPKYIKEGACQLPFYYIFKISFRHQHETPWIIRKPGFLPHPDQGVAGLLLDPCRRLLPGGVLRRGAADQNYPDLLAEPFTTATRKTWQGTLINLLL
jgi:hypothetical protein